MSRCDLSQTTVCRASGQITVGTVGNALHAELRLGRKTPAGGPGVFRFQIEKEERMLNNILRGFSKLIVTVE
jgi:hypothetical protein